jgi:hypothetical protein
MKFVMSSSAVSNSNSIVECVFVAVGTYLSIRCLESGSVTTVFIRPSRGHYTATAVHATVKSLCVTNQALGHEDVWVSGYTDACTLGLGTSWECSHSLSDRFYPQGKSSRYALDRRLSGPQNQYGRRGKGRNLVPTETRSPDSRPSSP